jgi:hypothetical protein
MYLQNEKKNFLETVFPKMFAAEPQKHSSGDKLQCGWQTEEQLTKKLRGR